MQRIGKKSFTKAKSKLLCFLLSGALLFGNLMAFQTVPASAAELMEQDNGNQETLQPKVIVSDYDELVQAIDESENGDVIGIDRIISICNDEDYLGAADKHITILKMSYNAYFEIAQSVKLTIRNLTFDGNRSKFNTRNTNPMLSANSNVIFQNVIIQNCYSQSGGAGLCVYSGVTNIYNCIFRDNHAIDGGHIKVFNTSIVNIRNTELTKGKANSDGGAIYISGETATVNFINSKIYGNQATGVGGGIKNNGKSFLKDTIIYGNTAESGADIANTMYAKFQIEEMDKLVKIYKSVNLLPKSWITDFDVDNRMPPHLIDLSQDYALVKLDYEEIPEEEKSDNKTDDIQDIGDSSVNGESKGDGNEEDNNGSNPAADNKDNTDENNTGDATVPDNDNTDDSNSGQGNSEEGTVAADSEKENDNKGNDSIENNENQENQEDKQENQSNQDSLGNDENKDSSSSDSGSKDTENGNVHTPDSSVGNGNQTGNSSIEKPNTNTNNNGSSSGSTTTSSEENKQPDSTVNNGNQGGVSAGNTESNSSNSNQNQTNTPVSGTENNAINNNPSANKNGGSGSSTENGNINTGNNTSSQSGGNVPSKPENNQDNNFDSSDNGGTAAITDNSQSVASNSDDGSSGKATVTKKKAIKKLTVTAKRGKKKITGKTIKKATVKVKIGKKIYKVKADSKGKFTIKLKGKAKLKKVRKSK